MIPFINAKVKLIAVLYFTESAGKNANHEKYTSAF